MTACRPVPEAATMPTLPRLTRLVKPRPTPLRLAVPQSGPMQSSPWSRAFRFRASSSCSETLSLKRKTLRSRSIQRDASRAAYSPGMDMAASDAPAN